MTDTSPSPQGPDSPASPPGTDWLLLQRLQDVQGLFGALEHRLEQGLADMARNTDQRLEEIRSQIASANRRTDSLETRLEALERRLESLEARIDNRFTDIHQDIAHVRNWSLGLLLLAILGLLVKLLVPGA